MFILGWECCFFVENFVGLILLLLLLWNSLLLLPLFFGNSASILMIKYVSLLPFFLQFNSQFKDFSNEFFTLLIFLESDDFFDFFLN